MENAFDLLVVNAPLGANDRQLPIINRSLLDVEMTGEISKPLGFDPFPNRETVLEIGWWNRLIVERDAHGHSGARAIVERDSIGDSIGAGRS